MSYYLDLETGEVFIVTDETRWELEKFNQAHVVTRVPVPEDVAELVLRPLQQSA